MLEMLEILKFRLRTMLMKLMMAYGVEGRVFLFKGAWDLGGLLGIGGSLATNPLVGTNTNTNTNRNVQTHTHTDIANKN